MWKINPIILVEDDKDDYEFFKHALKDLNIEHQLIWFENSIDAFDYLDTTEEQPFLIFSDINMHLQTGIEFKAKIDANERIRKKSIPFVFYSTAVDREVINKIYADMSIQGFFQKDGDFEKMKVTLKIIFDYWAVCKHPHYY
jgi:response regulator RpfG family c-di-GMP phosphodiesterase